MRINHNIPALNAHRILNRNNTNAAGTMERLSSGRRINRAKDDAAGMAISEKMKTQIRGLRKASQNTLDGISLIQTAEGAMNEVHSMLQRMRELAVQSANGTTTDEDRFAIQAEVNQLTSEVNRIANGTEFNTRKLLKGNEAPNSNTVVHRMSTGAPAVVNGRVDAMADIRSEYLIVTIDGQERTVRLNSISDVADADSRLEVINSALGSLGTAVWLDDAKERFEIRTESIGGLSNVTIEGSAAALAAYGLSQGITTGQAEVDSDNAKGTIYFNGLPERGSTITIGNNKIEFYDSSVAPYTGSNRPIDIFDQASNDYIDVQRIIDTIVDMEFPGIASIEQDTTSAGAATINVTNESVPFEANTAVVEAAVGDTLTITAPTGQTVDVTIQQAADDNLAVSGVGGNLVISLANTTPANNVASSIQALVQGLGTVGGTDFSTWTFTAGGNWDTATTGATITTATDSFSGGMAEELGEYTLSVGSLFAEGDILDIGGVLISAGSGLDIDTDTATTVEDQAAAIKVALDNNVAFNTQYNVVDNNDGTLTITENVGQATGVALEPPTVEGTSIVNRIVFTAEASGFAGQAVYIEGTPRDFVANLQIGPNQGQGFRLSVGDIRADKLMISATSPDGNTGVTGAAFSQFMEVTDGLSERKIQYAVDVSNEERATSAITVYNNAIVKVAQLRGELGAIQNRLEYTSANLDNTMENMTAALSRIEDTDMALEMSEFTKMNIMLQAGTAMLAQANQMPQMVLQLLQ